MEQKIQHGRICARLKAFILLMSLCSTLICEQVYGTARNDFLAASVAGRSVGKVFSIGEGEGRNACFLASLPGSDGDSAI